MLFSPHLLPPGKRKRDKKERERERKKKHDEIPGSWRSRIGPLPLLRASHLQKLAKHGFMATVKHEACRVLEDPVLPVPAEGYMVSFTVFYERGFGMPSHRFLQSLLQYYSLKLHHLTLLGVLHVVTFVTLCEAYLGIDPELDLWKYFFHVRGSQDAEAKLTIFERGGGGSSMSRRGTE
jgi:hypothetical protein